MKYDHGHAVFEDGHEIEFGWTGWPEGLPDSTAERLAYAEQVARSWAGPGYETMPITRIWLAG